MPIYEYECSSCGKRFDQLQRLSDPDPTDCPTCGAPQLKRAVTAASFRLKGGGWYETDFKGDRDKKKNLVESGDSKSSGSGEAKPDAKPEAKTESKADTKSETKAEPAKAASTAAPSTPPASTGT